MSQEMNEKNEQTEFHESVLVCMIFIFDDYNSALLIFREVGKDPH